MLFLLFKSLYKKYKKLGLTRSKIIKNAKIIVLECNYILWFDNKSSFIDYPYEFRNTLGGKCKNYDNEYAFLWLIQ